MSHSKWLDQTVDFSDSLDTELQQELATVLDQYLASLENGAPLSLEQLQADHPNLTGPLQEYFQDVAWLHATQQAVASGQPATDDARFALDAFTPQNLGDFRLDCAVGRGGMGTVYRALQLSLNRTVALKLLPLTSLLDQKQVHRFQNEARAAALLSHPNIVPVYSVGSEAGFHYYAMKFIEGDSLRTVLDRQALASESNSLHVADFKQIAEWVRQAALALHHAHENGVIHRDIKPSNLLVDSTGKLWVADFGLARCHTNVSITELGDVVGTLQYMSPEQASGQAIFADPAMDIYSLGATLYELLCGRPAFASDELANALPKIQEGEFKTVRQWNSQIPIDLERITLKAMATEKQDRYLSAAEFAEDLQRFLNGTPVIARPVSWGRRAIRWASRRRRLVMASVFVVCASIVASEATLFYVAGKNAELNSAIVRAQQNESLANEQAQTARENLQQAAYAVDQLGLQAADFLNSIPGTLDAQRALLLNARTFYEKMVEQASPEITKDYANNLMKLGDIDVRLGRKEEAREEFAQAARLLQELRTPASGNLDYTLALAGCWNQLGLLTEQAGNPREAETTFRQAIDLLQSSNALHAIAVQLGNSWNNLAMLQRTTDANSADSSFARSIAVLESANRDDRNAALSLAVVRKNWSEWLAGKGDDRAFAMLTAATTQLETLVQENHDQTPQLVAACETELAKAYAVWAKQSIPTTSLSDKKRFLMKAIRLQQQLVQRHPGADQWQFELAVYWNHLGMINAQQLGWADAERCFQRCVSLLNDRPTEPTFKRAAQNNLAKAILEQGRFADAEKILVNLLSESAAERPSSAGDIPGQASGQRMALFQNLRQLYQQTRRTELLVKTVRQQHQQLALTAEEEFNSACQLAQYLNQTAEADRTLAAEAERMISHILTQAVQHGVDLQRMEQPIELRPYVREVQQRLRSNGEALL
ncbi:MAG: serine/threonine protein kinase [Planctomycetales bacterium]|nr:serine/threonine protein kinase [Planctomycetales bacterium]